VYVNQRVAAATATFAQDDIEPGDIGIVVCREDERFLVDALRRTVRCTSRISLPLPNHLS
jgi:hypothetical protein